MGFDDVVPILIALYVLWSFVRGLFSARRGEPPTREHAQPEPSRFPWEIEPEPSHPEPSRFPWGSEAEHSVTPRASTARRASEPDAQRAWPYAETEIGEPATVQAGPQEPPALSSSYSSPGAASGAVPARFERSRARALLRSRRDLLRGVVAHEILGPPVSERRRG